MAMWHAETGLKHSIIIRRGVDQTVAMYIVIWRKVRTPQGEVPANGWEARAYGKCSREKTA